MRAALNALTDELKRLKASGVKSIVVSEESLVMLHKVAQARGPQTSAPSRAVDATIQSENRNPSPSAKVSETPTRYESAAPPKFTVKAVAAAPVSEFPAPPKIVLPMGDKPTRWAALLRLVQDDLVGKARIPAGKKPVLGVGNLDARIFFCGDVPGPEEEEQGEPFVGPAGQLLTRMISGMGLKRSDVYLGSLLNWRLDPPVAAGGAVPLGKRTPTAAELAYGLAYLKAQIEVVNPEIIVVLGFTVVQGLFGAGAFKTLGEVRGQWKLFAEKPVMVTYHPSYILNYATNRSKRAIWEDLLKVMERASLPITDKQQNFFLEK